MSNIGWHRLRSNPTIAEVTTEKHPYVSPFKVQSEFTDEQKEMIRTYNSMRAKLIEGGLMDPKT